MELKQIKEMMAAMTRHGTKRMVIKTQEYEVELERECAHTSHMIMPHRPLDIPVSYAPPIDMAVTPRAIEEAPGSYVTSPMVGTYYNTPSPEEPVFVKPGDKITEDTVVCIIEAMKVMNEVKAGISGTVAEVLVESGHPVEFGTKIIRVV